MLLCEYCLNRATKLKAHGEVICYQSKRMRVISIFRAFLNASILIKVIMHVYFGCNVFAKPWPDAQRWTSYRIHGQWLWNIFVTNYLAVGVSCLSLSHRVPLFILFRIYCKCIMLFQLAWYCMIAVLPEPANVYIHRQVWFFIWQSLH